MLLTLLPSGNVGKGDVFVTVLPIDFKAPLFHLLAKIFPAHSRFPAVHHSKGYILHIAFNLSLLCLFQELVSVLFERCGFLSLLSVKGLAFLGGMQPLHQTQAVGMVFHALQVCLALLELVTILETHAVHDEMRVNMLLVLVSGYQHFKPFPLRYFRCQSASKLVSLHRIYLLVWCKALDKVLVGASVRLAPQLLGDLHFLFRRVRLTVQTA